MSKNSLGVTYLLVEEAIQDGHNEALWGQRERTHQNTLALPHGVCGLSIPSPASPPPRQ